MSSLKDIITQDMKEALKNQQKARLSAIRLILTAIKQREVDERITLGDEQIFAILDKMAKQLLGSIAQYQQANRQDLVDKETAELEIIQGYLPTPLSEKEIDQLITQAIADVGANSMRDMGKVMADLKPKLQGRADIASVSSKIKQYLSD